MDMFDCGIYSFVNAITIDTIRYFAKNSFQHIDVVYNQTNISEATLHETFNTNLKKLYKSFQEIYDELGIVNRDTNIYYMIKRFLRANDRFIVLLERLKNEGYNGYPVQHLILYHIIYEQMYIKEIFRPLMYTREIQPQNVVINSAFRRIGLGTNPLDCIYGQLYFWSIIGAEHPAIIMNIDTEGNQFFSTKTINKFKNVIKDFNKITYNLSEIYPNLSIDNINIILKKFIALNKDFINILNQLKASLPYQEKRFSKIFISIIDHIINEHIYAKELTDKIVKGL